MRHFTEAYFGNCTIVYRHNLLFNRYVAFIRKYKIRLTVDFYLDSSWHKKICIKPLIPSRIILQVYSKFDSNIYK
jgi:hypothetical protein